MACFPSWSTSFRRGWGRVRLKVKHGGGLTWAAQFIRLCSWLKWAYTYTRMPQGGLSIFMRLARKRRGDAQLLSQYLRATNCYKLSDSGSVFGQRIALEVPDHTVDQVNPCSAIAFQRL